MRYPAKQGFFGELRAEIHRAFQPPSCEDWLEAWDEYNVAKPGGGIEVDCESAREEFVSLVPILSVGIQDGG